MFVVQVMAKGIRENEERYLDAAGTIVKRAEAHEYPSEADGVIAGLAFVDSGKGFGYSVDRAQATSNRSITGITHGSK